MSENEKKTCCLMRRKILIGIIAVLTEEQCGVSDAQLADVVDWGKATPSGKPVIAVKFCPWCGTPRTDDIEAVIVDPVPVDPDGELELPPGWEPDDWEEALDYDEDDDDE